jgi:hypothetical protein
MSAIHFVNINEVWKTLQNRLLIEMCTGDLLTKINHEIIYCHLSLYCQKYVTLVNKRTFFDDETKK